MSSKESSNSVEHSSSASLLEETVDFDHAEQEQQDTDSAVAAREEDDKTSPTKQPPAQQQQRKNSQVSQQTIRHRNSSKKKAFSGQVAARLEQAVAQASIKPVNRSADLVPLTHEYDKMKRRLRALITAAKQYHESMGRVYRARMEVRLFVLFQHSDSSYAAAKCQSCRTAFSLNHFLLLVFFSTGRGSSCHSSDRHSHSRKDWQ